PARSERMAPRSPAASMAVKMSESTPGAGSSTSVRSWCSAFSSLRYCTSSAWQRRQASTCRRRPTSAAAVPSTIPGRAPATSSHRMGLLLSPVREQLLPQPAAGAVEADLGRRLRDPELRRDRLVGHVVDVAQHDDRPQPRRQLLQRGLDAVVERAPLSHRLGVDLWTPVGDSRVLLELLVPVPVA